MYSVAINVASGLDVGAPVQEESVGSYGDFLSQDDVLISSSVVLLEKSHQRFYR